MSLREHALDCLNAMLKDKKITLPEGRDLFTTDLSVLGLDSLDRVALTMEIENEAGVEIPYQELGEIRSVSDLCSVVERLGDERG